MRKYRPVIGRWLSRDPIEEEDNGNLYCHTYNCLVNGFDYLGKQWNGSLSEKGGRVTYSKKFETQNELWYFLGAIDVNISATLELEPDDRPSGKCVPPSLLPFSSSPLTFSPTLWPLGYTTSIEFLWGKRASMSVTSVAKEYGLWTTFDKQLSYAHKSCFWAEEFCKCFNYKLSASISTFSVINNAGLAFSIMLLRNPNAIFLFGTSLLGELPKLTWGGQELIPAFVY